VDRRLGHLGQGTHDGQGKLIMATTDAVILALEEQVGLYQRLAKLAELQHEHVQQNQIESLLDVLAQREGVLAQVGKLETVIAAAKRRWSEYLGALAVASRSRAESLLAETRRLLEQITAADRNDAMVLQQRKLNLGRQINQATAAKQVNRNYAAAAYGARPAQMDLKR
jgi:hypothetical protein